VLVEHQLLQPYSEFLTLLGHKVIHTGDMIWLDVRPGIFQPAASFQAHAVTDTDLARVRYHKKVLACRWFSDCGPVSAAGGRAGPTVYNAKPPYDLSSLNQKARNQTRRGLEKISVRRVELTESLEPQCYRVYEDNLKRLGLLQRKGQIESKWRRWVAAIRMGKCVELWTASNEGELVALSVAVRTPWGTEIVLQRSAGSGRSLYPNNALIYEMVRDSFSRGSEVMSFGLSAYSAMNNGLDHFKQGMGFRALRLEEHYSWNSLLKPFASVLKPERLRSLYRFVSHSSS
jgi:hypothetical protein